MEASVLHSLPMPSSSSPSQSLIRRHFTTPKRREPSRPIRALVEECWIVPGMSHFDYGCGYGTDVAWMCQQGYDSSGWDPACHPDRPVAPADAVTLLFVLNVIEDRQEREMVLWRAYSLARQLLAVAVTHGSPSPNWMPYEDGHLTRWRTFEKMFRASEIRTFLQAVLGCPPVLIRSSCYGILARPTEPLLAYSLSPEDRQRHLERYKKQRARLKKHWIPSPRVFLDSYTAKGKYRYWQLRSPVADLPNEKGERVKVLHLGAIDSEKYRLAMAALERRTRLEILDARLSYLRQAIAYRRMHPLQTSVRTLVAPPPQWVQWIRRV